MKLETFFEKFDQFADASNAVAKMRELILTLAISGRLIDQGAEHKPSIESILQHKRAELKRAKVRKHPETNPPEREEHLFEAPDNWLVCRLGDLCWSAPTSYGENPSPDLHTKLVVKVGNISPDGFFKGAFSERGFPAELVDSLTARAGDLMVVKSSGSAENVHSGKTAICTKEHEGALVGSNFVMRLRPLTDLVDHSYLWRVVTSRTTRQWVEGTVQTMTYPNLKWSDYSQLPVALPPLAEQKRIVAKVDKLMALCDRLEAQQQERDARHADLARASLARFAEAPTPANLNLLFHKSYPIAPADLRKSILTLAVQGKLVPQDPKDEPAEMIVDRVSALREQVSPGKRAKAAKRIRELDDAKCSHDVPDLWAWCRLGDLVLDFRYGTSRKCARNVNGVPVLRIPNIQSGRIDSTDLKFTDMPPTEFKELRLQEGDLLLVRSNGSENLVGRSAVASADDERFAYAGYLVRARLPKKEVFAPFLHVALSTPSIRDQIEGPIRTTSGVKNINTTELSNLVIPLPPLAEQRRIVTKVDQLMSLVDELETQLAASRETASQLLEAVVAELTSQHPNS